MASADANFKRRAEMTHAPNKEGTNREQAEYWLEKAVAYEADPQRTAKMVEMAFGKALACENAAIAAKE